MVQNTATIPSRWIAFHLLLGCCAMTCLASGHAAAQETSAQDGLPLAWLEFFELDRRIQSDNSPFFYYTGTEKVEVEIDVPPSPEHKLAVKWVCRQCEEPKRSMRIAVNGRAVTVAREPVRGDLPFFWVVVPVTDFGITFKRTGIYKISIDWPGPPHNDGLIGGFRLITDASQLETVVSEDPKTKFINPGRITQEMLTADPTMNLKKNDPVSEPALPGDLDADKYLLAAAHFADAWLSYGIDNYGVERSPLFADLVDSETLLAPRIGVIFKRELSKRMMVSEYAGQQNFMRTLVALTKLTGIKRYRRAADDSARYMFDRYWDESAGLLKWGEHNLVNLYTEGTVGLKGTQHELKGSLPYYTFLYQVDPEKSRLMMEGIWQAHLRDWKSLAFGRHGKYQPHKLDGSVWKKPWSDPGIDFEEGHLAFIASGFELANGALRAGYIENNPEIAQWGQRMVHQFVRQAHPRTKLIPSMLYHPSRDPNGDRVRRSYMPEYPQAREKDTYLMGYQADLNTAMLGILAAAKDLSDNKAIYTESLQEDIEGIRDHLKGYFKYAYNPKTHKIKVIIVDGTDLTGYVTKNVSYGTSADPIVEHHVFEVIYPEYSRAITFFPKDKELWVALRTLLQNEGAGDIGTFEAKRPKVDPTTTCDSPYILFALIDLFESTENRSYLDFADVVAANTYKNRFHPKTGLFTKDQDHHLAQVDTYEPLAFVTLWAAKHGKLDEVPRFNGGGRYLWGGKLMHTGYGPFYHVVNNKGVADVTKDDGYLHQVLGTWSKRDRDLLEATNVSDVYKNELLERWYPEEQD